MAAEREALQRQIQLLQNLIEQHKSVHGDAPAPGTRDQSSTWTRTSTRSTELPPVRVQSTLPTAQEAPGSAAASLTKATVSRDAARARKHRDSDLTTTVSTPALSRPVRAPPPVTLTTTSVKPAQATASLKPALTTTSLNSALTTASLKPSLTTTSVKPALPTASLKPALTTASVKPALTTASVKSALTTASVKSALSTTSVKPALTTTSVKPALTTTSVKPALTTTSVKPALTTTSVKPVLSTTSIKPALTTTSIKPVLTTTSMKPALTTTSINPVLSTTSIKPALTTTSIKPALTTTSIKPVLTTTSIKPVLTTVLLSSPSSVISSKLTQSKTSRRPVTSETLRTSVSEAATGQQPDLKRPGPDQTQKHCPGPDQTKKHGPAKARIAGRSKFTWVRPVTPKGAAAALDPDSGPIRRSRVSTLSKSRYQWVSRVQKSELVETSPKSLRPGTSLKTSPKGPKGSSSFRWAAPQRSVVTASSSPITTEFKHRNRTKIIHKTSSPEVRTTSGPKPRTGPRTLVSRHRLRRVSPGSGPKHKELVSVSRHKLRRVRPESTDKGPEGRTSPQSTPRSSLTRSRAKELVSVSRHKLRRIRPESRDQGPESRTSPQSTPRSRTKELVSVSRHKLRRISPVLCRSQSWRSPHTRSPQTRTQTRSRSRTVSAVSPPQLICSRFKMDKRPVHGPPHSRSRSPLTRLRPSPRSSASMCWIRGTLFKVSANQLSRAPPPRSSGPAPFSPPGSASRNLARSVLLRSLSIVRSSGLRLRHKQRQFCMFYNRFGRCNRGDQCPYVHDKEKVAVCTRFLRGRCKQGDSCPFSHKVSKDKMPVCSFFLRGCCSHTDCPYSHVYVSRDAQVCEDFLRGYCPQGQKCKKKHTLVCQDKNCSRGNDCKLQHRRPIKRSTARKSRLPVKRSRSPQTPDPAAGPFVSPGHSPGLSPGLSPGPVQGPGLQKQPSFISLCSSPDEPEPPAEGAVLRGGMLPIKPRFTGTAEKIDPDQLQG